MDGARDGGYMWFDGCRVFSEDMRLLCAVDGHTVPLPVAILHPDCMLRGPGDAGRLGVPRKWAEQRGLGDTRRPPDPPSQTGGVSS